MREPMPREVISALIRDPESGYYPSQIGVFCDNCGTHDLRDYLVREDQDQPVRFEVARRHLRENEGWTCGESGDFCPACRNGDAEEATR